MAAACRRDLPPELAGRAAGELGQADWRAESRLIAGDVVGAQEDARWALAAGAADSESPIGRYAATLAELVLGADDRAATLVSTLDGADAIPPAVATSLAALATADAAGYDAAIRDLVADFESREEFLEDVPVADTVLALQVLAAARGLDVELSSVTLPPDAGPGP